MSRITPKLAVLTAIFFLSATASATESFSAREEFWTSAESVVSSRNPFEVVTFMSPVPPLAASTLERLPVAEFEAEATLPAYSAVESSATPSRFQALTTYALTYLGNRYKYGGNNPATGIDCSGFVKYVFNKVGVNLPRTALQQASVGAIVRKADLKLGDLVFFNTLGRSLSHVGIYLGNGDFVHASGVNRGIKIDTLATGYFSSSFEGGRSIR